MNHFEEYSLSRRVRLKSLASKKTRAYIIALEDILVTSVSVKQPRYA